MAAYATPADMITRYDVRVLGDLVSDTGTRVASGSLSANAVLLAVLEDASGEIDSACLQAKRYTSADLAALTGNSAAHLKRITCTIAFGLLWERRPWSDDDDSGREEAQKRARQQLDMLRKGITVFDVEEAKDAGLPAVESTAIQIINSNNLPVDQARGHYYPRRRLPTY